MDVAVPQQVTVLGGMLSLRKSIKKRKLSMKHVRLKNLEIEYLFCGNVMLAAAQMFSIGCLEIALC
ncbi:hypothetical protein N9778_01030 [Hyphomicrobiales bacterium]|nr:hypothetical protein [Hyphomicrobiales bacterium]